MKKQNKKIVTNLFIFFNSVLMLICGVFWKEWGYEGKGIILIMCSLYTAMWVHAGIVGDRIGAQLDEIKDEIGKSGAVEKTV